MLEDKLLVLKCKRGSREAMCVLYRKYKDYLLTLANALLNDRPAAEDVVHDVFLSFAKSLDGFRLTGSLKGYLATCTGNRARDRLRAGKHRPRNPGPGGAVVSSPRDPQRDAIETEELTRLRQAMSQLPYEQREAVVLHLKGGMKFREIAALRGVSISTIHGRYRYGLDKIRSLLNSEVTK
ncbi:MAG: sigma-70 family RNA polymerase sigma factor [Phycisphaerales bacterium]|nr:MAG: sigma-70 family RNA polymerase sigma factor [Phycisphaerales bacterium]